MFRRYMEVSEKTGQLHKSEKAVGYSDFVELKHLAFRFDKLEAKFSKLGINLSNVYENLSPRKLRAKSLN